MAKISSTLYCFFIATLSSHFFCRLFLFDAIATSSFETIPYRVAAISFGLLTDLLNTITISLISALMYFFIQFIISKEQIKQGLFHVWLFSIFVIQITLWIIHFKIFNLLYTGINFTFLQTAFHQGLSTLNLYTFITWLDLIFLTIYILFYFGIFCCTKNFLRQYVCYGFLPIFLLLIVFGAATFQSRYLTGIHSRYASMFLNPFSHIVIGYLDTFRGFNNKKIIVELNNNSQWQDPIFLKKTQTPAILSPLKVEQKNWNIVIFILESVNYQSAFENMFFLRQLAQKSLWFQNHYTGGNISALGQFSIFTGLYPHPTPCHFEMQNHMHIQSMPEWFGKQYASLMVSSSNDLYFSSSINKTFSTYLNANNIKQTSPLLFNMFANEKTSFQTFLTELVNLKSPFLAVYWSNAAHFPYRNFDNLDQEQPCFTNRFQCYLSGLRMVDTEIQQTFDTLMLHNLIDKTIFMIVGDHGEMFGEHQSIAHGTTLFQEEIKVPLVIYAPKIFKAKRVTELTSSNQILPTILSLLNIDDENQLQGESLLKPQKNEYIFVYGDQDEIAAIDQTQQKMIISFSNNHCVTYDLSLDPFEKNPLTCNDAKQEMAILKFRYLQPKILAKLNEKKH